MRTPLFPIGEDNPLKVYRFNLQKFEAFILSKLDKLAKEDDLVSQYSTDKRKDAWLRGYYIIVSIEYN